jgi:hypothetical protein
VTNVTQAYRKHFRTSDPAETERVVAPLLDGQHVLFVRGFLSEAVVMLGDAARLTADLARVSLGAPLIGSYFDDQIQWLDRRGIASSCVEIEAEASVADNADRIRERLEKLDRVTIVSHSKGCLDTLHALIANPALRGRVRRWIAIQGPFAGTPVADCITDSKVLDPAAQFVLECLFRGSISSLGDMRTDIRARYLERHGGEIDALLGTIPTLCYASSADAIDTFLASTVLLIQKERGGINDGLVPRESAKLPGAHHVEDEGVDHAMPVMKSLPSEVVSTFARARFLQALLLSCPERP